MHGKRRRFRGGGGGRAPRVGEQVSSSALLVSGDEL
jgi:hypothetical protein